MIKNVLVHIHHIEVYPLISLVLFVLVFSGSIVWALGMKKSDAAALASLPLNDSAENEGGSRHE